MVVTGHSRQVASVTFVQGYLLATMRASVEWGLILIWQRWEVTTHKYFVTVAEYVFHVSTEYVNTLLRLFTFTA